MRTFRTLTIVLAILALVAGTAIGVVAQSEEADAMAPALVTGTVEGEIIWAEVDRTYEAGITQTRGVGSTGLDIVSSDPRLGGAISGTGNWDEYPGGLHVAAGSIAIRDDQGAWVGIGTGFDDGLDEGGVDLGTWQLAGEGACEGLSAYLVLDSSGPSPAFQGAIFPGEVPAFPEPVAVE